MPIIISKEGRDARQLERTSFKEELELQKYIENNPESIPIEDVKKEAKVVILAREFPVQTGSIDSIGIDQDGDICIIETKLYKNTDKRYILAQILEYGAFLYKTYGNGEQFMVKLEECVTNRYGISLRQKVSEFFKLDKDKDEVENIIQAIKDNFDHSIFRFFIVMDVMPEYLEEIILFVNESSKFDIFLVELEYYEHDGYQILIPRLFGKILKKYTGGAADRGRIWSEKSFFERVKREISDSQVKDIINKLYKFTKQYSSLDPWPKWPTKYAVFNFYAKIRNKNICLFQVRHYGTIYFYALNPEKIRILNDMGFSIPEDAKEKEPRLDIFKKQVSLDNFKTVIKDYIAKVKEDVAA